MATVILEVDVPEALVEEPGTHAQWTAATLDVLRHAGLGEIHLVSIEHR